MSNFTKKQLKNCEKIEKHRHHSAGLLADGLGISRQTVYRVMKKHKLEGTTLPEILEYIKLGYFEVPDEPLRLL